MVVSNSVQLYGVENVVQAFCSRAVPRWAIYHNKQFLFKCESKDMPEAEAMLRNTLEMIAGSVATYTLCVYENPANGKIGSKTEHDGSFNFQLNQREAVSRQGSDVMGVLMQIRQSQIEQELRLQELEAEPEGEEEPTILSGIAKVLEIPAVAELAGTMLSRLFPQRSATMAGIAGVDVGGGINVNSDLDMIRTVIPDIDEIIHKLALMAETTPDKLAAMQGVIKTFI